MDKNNSQKDSKRMETQNPFLALKSYEEIHESIFGGRDAEIKKIFDLIDKNIVTIVSGKPGIGKTSLLNAGVIPMLREDYYLPIYIRIDFNLEKSPLVQTKEFVETKIKGIDENAIPFNDLSLWEYFHNVEIYKGKVKPVLIFDQFEEIFTIGKTKTSELNEFITEIANLIENRMPLSVQKKYKENEESFASSYIEQNYRAVFSLREEYLPQLENINMYVPSVRKSRFRVMPLNGDNAVKAIEKTGKDIIVENVAKQIIQKMPDPKSYEYIPYETNKRTWENKKVEPYLLSLFCSELNAKRLEKGDDKIDEALIKETELTNIINNYYEKNVKTDDKKIKIENSLLTSDGKRQLQTIEKFGMLESDIKYLEDKRIIRKLEREGTSYVELIHDVLAEIVKESRDDRLKKEREQAEKKKIKSMYLKKYCSWIIAIVIFAAFLFLYQHKVAKKNEALKKLGFDCLKNSLVSLSEKDFNSTRLYSLYALKYLKEDEEGRYRARTNILSYPEYLAISSYNCKNSINSVYFSHDGNVLAAGNDGNTVILMDAKIGTEIRNFPGHSDSITSVSFSPDGKILASGSEDRSIKLWNVNSGKEIISLKDIHSVNCIRFSPNGNILATGGMINPESKEGIIILWNVKNGTEIKRMKGNYSPVFDADFTPDGNTLASCSNEGIIFWDVKKSETIPEMKDYSGFVTNIKFSPDGKTLAASSKTGSFIKICDVKSKEKIVQFKVKNVNSICFYTDGKSIAVVSDKKITLWSLKSNSMVSTLGKHDEPISTVQFSSDGTKLASGSKDKKIKIWDIRSGKVSTLKGHLRCVSSLDFSPTDDKMLASGSRDKTIKIWNLETCVPITLKGHKENVASVVFSLDGKLLISGSWDKTIKIWDIEKKKKREIFTLKGHTSEVECVVFPPNNSKRIASGSWDRTIRIWDIETGEMESICKGHTNIVSGISFLPNGRELLSGSLDNMVKLWNIKDRKELSTVYRHVSPIYSIGLSPVGSKLAIGGVDRTIILLDIITGKKITALEGHLYAIHTLRFSPDGKKLASGSSDCTIKIWDLSYLVNKFPIDDQIRKAEEKYKLVFDGVKLVPKK